MLNVLVLCDDPDQVETLARGLLHLGVACTCVRTAREAAASLAGGSFSLLLADVSAPSGARLVAELLRARGAGDIPVLIVAGLVLWPAAHALVACGALLLRKPFTPEQLGRAIEVAISKGMKP